ncbi:ABC transporter permease [Amycolatopsis aidingensis]|uniref:ABC transporter permease n=1 Tax=Amycolatopsis aidingensis TaxID=2842453 RepID=UPI001C0D5E79|nr:ABC transporter permease [Amycolatopsis aidingensis]
MNTTTTETFPARRRLGKAMTAIGNEIVKGLRHGWAERTQIVIELPIFVTFMLLLGFIVGQGDRIIEGRMTWSMDPSKAAWLFLGFSVYMLVYLQIQKMFWRTLAEIQTGTLEQTYLSPLPSWVATIVGRALSAIIEAGLVIAVMYTVMDLVIDLPLTWRLDALIPVAFVLLSGAGFALIIAGLTLVFKRIEMFNDLVLLLLLFVSGVVIAEDGLPEPLAAISPYVFLTHPVEGVRRIMFEDQSMLLWGTGGYVWTAVSTVGWLVAGLVIFHACETYAKRAGTLGQY